VLCSAVDVGKKFDQIIRLPGLGGDGGREHQPYFGSSRRCGAAS
jgi:hypothetical protein